MTQARHLALDVLQQIESHRQTLDHCLSMRSEDIDQLNRADRALLHHIVFGVMRWRSRLDWIINHALQKPNKKIDPTVHNILRIALYQLIYLDRIPQSAVVNTAVKLTKACGLDWASGFVNGLLRRVTREPERLDAIDLAADSMKSLALKYAFPEWLISRWHHRFGITETEALCRAMNTIPAITLRTNTLKVTRQILMKAIEDEVSSVLPSAHTPEGIRIHSPQRPIAHWDSYKQGLFQVQDEAAQLIAHMVDPRPGQTIWDACAGMGTKTSHLAQLMQNDGHIIASDRKASKLKQLDAEMQRLGISIVQSCTLDLIRSAEISELPRCDRVLVDAPCSGTGVLQKNPDGKWRLAPKDIQGYARNQIYLLDRTSEWVKPQGLLIYAVCSIDSEENEMVVQSFLEKHHEFCIHPPSMHRVSDPSSLTTPQGWFYTLPNRNQMDGFFATVLKRIH
jgi:16S rRNA (cytosine967-C5)-methyltransferase